MARRSQLQVCVCGKLCTGGRGLLDHWKFSPECHEKIAAKAAEFEKNREIR